MTCIVGIETPKGVIMGGDRNCGGVYYARPLAIPKVIKRTAHGHEWLIGACGDARDLQLLFYGLKLPAPPRRASDMSKFISTKVVDAIRAAFKNGGKLEKDNSVESFEGIALIAIRGKLYEIGGYFGVVESTENYAATGSGRSLAMGALYATESWKDQRRRITVALEAAAKFSGGVREPFDIVSGAK